MAVRLSGSLSSLPSPSSPPCKAISHTLSAPHFPALACKMPCTGSCAFGASRVGAPFMTPISSEALLESLRWRYATKQFDPTRVIPEETWMALEASLVLTPSSFGLQPWKFLVITDPALKARLRPHCWNQSQVTDCSHLVVFCGKQEMDADYLDAFMQSVASSRQTTADTLAGYRNVIAGSVLGEGSIAQMLPEWSARQAYIALGQLMLSAALLGIDTCPMEGFVPEAVDNELNLPQEGFRAVVLCPLGYRSAQDKYAEIPKVRWPSSLVIEHR